ncbi:hypothetical protein MTR67_051375, partial [Solanum verrucosum]
TSCRRSTREKRSSTRYSPNEYILLTNMGEPEGYDEVMLDTHRDPPLLLRRTELVHGVPPPARIVVLSFVVELVLHRMWSPLLLLALIGMEEMELGIGFEDSSHFPDFGS